MDDADLLPTLAEVAVTFAGFASLISVVGGRASGDQLVANLLRLRSMLQSALIVFIASLAPFLPHKLGASSEASWRYTGGVLVTACLLMVIPIYRRLLSSTLDPRILAPVLLAQLAAGTLLAIAVVSPTLISISGAYHALLFAFVGTAAILFMRVVSSAFVEDGPAA